MVKKNTYKNKVRKQKKSNLKTRKSIHRKKRVLRGGNCGCGLFKGGSSGCSQCGQQGGKKQRGGNSLAATNVGFPWTSNINTWPGVAGLDGQSNYFALNTYPVDPQTSMISERNFQLGPPSLTNTPNPRGYLLGGKKGRKSRKNQKGGLFPFDDITNATRNILQGMGNTYNTMNGYPEAVSPSPYKDQITNRSSL